MARNFYIEDNEAIPAIAFENAAPAGYSLIVDNDQLDHLYNLMLVRLEEAGKAYFRKFESVRLRQVHNGDHTEAQQVALNKHIKEVMDELRVGQWKVAQDLNSNLSLSGIYTQAVKDEIQLEIDTFVTNNY